MTNLTTVTLTAGAGSGGNGTVSTLDNVIGTAGAASAQVQTVQGIASMTALKVDGSAVTQPVSIASLPSGAVTNAGTFAVQVTSAPSTAVTNAGTFAVQVSNANANGRATPTNSAPVTLNSMSYVTVAASTTQQCGSTGATGDYLDGVLIIPGTTAAGVVQIKDGSGSAITIFAGGGTALTTLIPFYVPIGAVSSGGTGGWKVITLTNVTCIAVGNFT